MVVVPFRGGAVERRVVVGLDVATAATINGAVV